MTVVFINKAAVALARQEAVFHVISIFFIETKQHFFHASFFCKKRSY